MAIGYVEIDGMGCDILTDFIFDVVSKGYVRMCDITDCMAILNFKDCLTLLLQYKN